jgi:hypothetical protein
VPMSVLRNTYPWRAVGKLFFTGATGGSFVCSASVVRKCVIAAAGQPTRELSGNILVGITSYGPVSLTERYLGSSILNAEWVAIWNIACGQPGACA